MIFQPLLYMETFKMLQINIKLMKDNIFNYNLKNETLEFLLLSIN